MTREECEKMILELLKAIDSIHKAYNPHANYLSLCCLNGQLSANNSYAEGDKDHQINITLFADGEIMQRTFIKDKCDTQLNFKRCENV